MGRARLRNILERRAGKSRNGGGVRGLRTPPALASDCSVFCGAKRGRGARGFCGRLFSEKQSIFSSMSQAGDQGVSMCMLSSSVVPDYL